MLERNDCHTLDRANFRAQLDCNSAKQSKIKEAVDAMFKVNHWPYMHVKKTKSLIEAISLNSWDNIASLQNASKLVTNVAGFIASSAAIYLSI